MVECGMLSRFAATIATVTLLLGVACWGVAEAPTELNPAPTIKKPVSFSAPLSQPIIQTPNRVQAQVINVVDGDTIEVRIDGRKLRVRYIGIETPETVHPTRAEEPHGREASDRNKELSSPLNRARQPKSSEPSVSRNASTSPGLA